MKKNAQKNKEAANKKINDSMLLYFSFKAVSEGKCFFIIQASSGLEIYSLNVRKKSFKQQFHFCKINKF